MSDMRKRWLLIGGIGSVLLLLIGYFLIISPAQVTSANAMAT